MERQNKSKRIFVTAIGTDSGKTIASAILCEAFGADYWKPVQAGSPFDADTIRSLVTNTRTKIHVNGISLKTPESPHAAAKREGFALSADRLALPTTDNDLVIEGAGGCLVPLNDSEFVIDLAIRYGAKVILVSNFYLGSINHTILTLEALKKRNLPVAGIIFNGLHNEESERIITVHSNLPCLLRIEPETAITSQIIKKYADRLSTEWLR